MVNFMDRQERMNLIERIQKVRNSKLIVYITGDRPNLQARIGANIFPSLHEHLINVGNQPRIDLFLYSTGGDTMTGYALVNLFREFCNEFNVIIPFKAHSCATLISLGANEIVMTKMGQLTPIDPFLDMHPLAPIVELPNQPKPQIVSINVEEINAFISVAKEEFKLHSEESMRSIFSGLVSNIHPLVLGAIRRSSQQINFLASRLLAYTMTDKEHINKIVEILTHDRFAHNYVINKKEARKELGLNIVDPDPTLNSDIITLFNAYSEMLKFTIPYNSAVINNPNKSKTDESRMAIIESLNLTHTCKNIFSKDVSIGDSWKIENDI